MDIPRDDLSVTFLLPHPDLRQLIPAYNIYGAFGPKVGCKEWYFPAWTTIRLSYTADVWLVRYGAKADEQRVHPFCCFGASVCDIQSSGAPQGISIGFGVNPLGVQRLLGVRADQICERLTDMSEIWPDAARIHAEVAEMKSSSEIVPYLDTLLIDRLGPPIPEESQIAAMLNLLVEEHDIGVREVAERLDLSEATLRRIALRHFGFPIKILLRRSRFMKSLVAIYGQEAGQWAQLIDASYHDQSHFIKDCREFLNCTPSQFLSHERPMTQLSMAARRKMLGAPLSALHKS